MSSVMLRLDLMRDEDLDRQLSLSFSRDPERHAELQAERRHREAVAIGAAAATVTAASILAAALLALGAFGLTATEGASQMRMFVFIAAAGLFYGWGSMNFIARVMRGARPR